MPHYSKHKRSQLDQKIKLDQIQFQKQMKEYRMRQREIMNQNNQTKILQKLKSDKLRFITRSNSKIQAPQKQLPQIQAQQQIAIQTEDLRPIQEQFQQVDQQQAELQFNLQRLDVKVLRVKALKGMEWLDQEQKLMEEDLKKMEEEQKRDQMRKEKEIKRQQSIQQEKIYPASSLSGRTGLGGNVNSRFRWSSKESMWGGPIRNSQIQSSSPARSRQVKPRQLISFRKPPAYYVFAQNKVRVAPGVNLQKLFDEDLQ